ncbi:MAG: hypothetical protein ACRC7F_05135 [Cetobacterium sp.]|uniref:hypothetical protein n=1 Tax=unclassified Cetobacterium TaxID=2630983 RepID=UPI00064854F2|nr:MULTISPECIES: hypothetical protein [unclassified Cetobacterium]
MVSPKERVRANIYKTLLEEEKKKKKKMSVFSLSLFVVGVFTGTSYDKIINKNIAPTESLVAFESGELQKKVSEKKDIGFTIDDLFQADEIRINRRDFNTENLFVTDLQI